MHVKALDETNLSVVSKEIGLSVYHAIDKINVISKGDIIDLDSDKWFVNDNLILFKCIRGSWQTFCMQRSKQYINIGQFNKSALLPLC